MKSSRDIYDVLCAKLGIIGSKIQYSRNWLNSVPCVSLPASQRLIIRSTSVERAHWTFYFYQWPLLLINVLQRTRCAGKGKFLHPLRLCRCRNLFCFLSISPLDEQPSMPSLRACNDSCLIQPCDDP